MGKLRRVAVVVILVAAVQSTAPAGLARPATVSQANVKDFSARFENVLRRISDPLIRKLRSLRPSGNPERTVSFTMPAAGGTVDVEGFGIVLPKPAKFELTLNLHNVRDNTGNGRPLILNGLLQFDLVPYASGKAVGLFAGRPKLSGAFTGTPDITGEVDGTKLVALKVVSGGKTLTPTKRGPRPFVSYVSTVAGNDQSGLQDGQGGAARFDGPSGVAVADDGTIYVTDEGNNAVRRITPSGNVTTLADSSDGVDDPADLGIDNRGHLVVTQGTYADVPLIRIDPKTKVVTNVIFNEDETGEGYCGLNLPPCEGRSPLGTMTWPEGIDVQGSVSYVAEYAPSWIRIVLPDATVATAYKGPAGNCDSMSDVAKGNDGEMYFVAHWAYCDGVFVVRPDGTTEILAGNDDDEFGPVDGVGPAAQFFHPTGIVYDGSRYVYVTELQNLIRRVDVETGAVRRVAGCIPHAPGFNCDSSNSLRDGDGEFAQFNNPERLTQDQWGDLYVADSSNNAIRLVRIVDEPEREPAITGFQPFIVTQGQSSRVEVTGNHLALVESATFGPGVSVELHHGGSQRLFLDIEVAPDAELGGRTLAVTTPYGAVSTPPALSLVVAKKGDAAEVETIAGTGNWLPGVTDGPGDIAQFAFPSGMVAIDEDRLLVADPVEQRIRLVATKEGAVQEVVELALYASGAVGDVITLVLDGLGVAGQLLGDLGLGNIIGDPEEELRGVIAQGFDQMCEEANSDCDWIVLPWAGLPLAPGEKNGFRLGSTYLFPTDIGKASASKFFIADAGNQRVRVVGINPLDDQPKDAEYEVFSTVRSDARPISVTDTTGNNALLGLPGRIVQVDMRNSGVYTDIAGDPDRLGCGTTDTGGQAIGIPMGMDRAGGITYIADPFCQTVWMIDEEGQLSDIRGSVQIPGPNLGGCSDGPAAIAGFGAPVDVAAGPGGTIWIVDALCNSVRVIYDAGEPIEAVLDLVTDYLSLVEDHLPDGQAEAIENGINQADANVLASIRYWVTTVAGSLEGEHGFVDGPADRARFSVPLGIETIVRDGKLTVFVSDAGNRRIRMLTFP